MATNVDVVRFFTAKHDVYKRFIRMVGYQHGVRTFFGQSSLLLSGLRMLDAGYGTGAETLALHEALVRKGLEAKSLDAFGLTPAMLRRFQEKCQSRGIQVRTTQANVLELDRMARTVRGFPPGGISTRKLSHLPTCRDPSCDVGACNRGAENG